jgi:Lrp/AsnC family leucine-responsive transcriptional regulator
MQPDELHFAILNQLQTDARLSHAEIGRRVGLTGPAVAERVKRMQDEGIIKSFATEIDFARLGYGQKAWIGIKLPQSYINAFIKEASQLEGVTDIIHTTGDYCFFVAVTVRSVPDLGGLLENFSKFGETTTFSILSVPVARKIITLPARPLK